MIADSHLATNHGLATTSETTKITQFQNFHVIFLIVTKKISVNCFHNIRFSITDSLLTHRDFSVSADFALNSVIFQQLLTHY